jgi:hypothetical protein
MTQPELFQQIIRITGYMLDILERQSNREDERRRQEAEQIRASEEADRRWEEEHARQRAAVEVNQKRAEAQPKPLSELKFPFVPSQTKNQSGSHK